MTETILAGMNNASSVDICMTSKSQTKRKAMARKILVNILDSVGPATEAVKLNVSPDIISAGSGTADFPVDAAWLGNTNFISSLV